MKNSHRGFSLVEIMIVVFIIALLAAIAIPNLMRAKVNANESAAQASLKLISVALENYAASNDVYPTNVADLSGPQPPYLSVDYFTNTYNGYDYTETLASYSYSIQAVPISANLGTRNFSITTGGALKEF